MTDVTFTLKGRRFSMTTEEARTEAKRITRLANEADREAAANPPRGLLQGGFVTEQDILAVVTAKRTDNSPGQVYYDSHQAWLWILHRLVEPGELKATCLRCLREINQPWCYCVKIRTVGFQDKIAVKASDLIRLKDKIFADQTKMNRPVRRGLFPLLDEIEQLGMSSH